MAAADCYSRGIEIVRGRGSDTDAEQLNNLLVKRGFAYFQLRCYFKALTNAKEVMNRDSKHAQALKLSCVCVIELGYYQAAVDGSQYILALSASEANKSLAIRAMTRLEQAAGNFDWEAIAAVTYNNTKLPDVSSFQDEIEVRRSDIHGRGMFAKTDLEQGQLLLCEKAAVYCYDEDHASPQHGFAHPMMGGAVLNRRYV